MKVNQYQSITAISIHNAKLPSCHFWKIATVSHFWLVFLFHGALQSCNFWTIETAGHFRLVLYLKASLSINVAYNDVPEFFEIANNSMVEYPYLEPGTYSYTPNDYEILEVFFKNVKINWIDCNYTWGWYDHETGRWTGATGKVTMNTSLLK